MTVGLIAALPAEARFAARHRINAGSPVQLNNGLIAMVSGMGPERARKAAVQLVQLNVEALISWGTAAALAGELKAGDLVLPDRVHGYNGTCFTTDTAWRQALNSCLKHQSIHSFCGGLAETPAILSSREQKSELHRRSAAICADMETAAILATARGKGLPAIAIRAIVDTSDVVLPVTVTQHLNRYGEPDMWQLVRSVIARPALLPKLIRLAGAMRKAGKTLRKIRLSTNETIQYPY